MQPLSSEHVAIVAALAHYFRLELRLGPHEEEEAPLRRVTLYKKEESAVPPLRLEQLVPPPPPRSPPKSVHTETTEPVHPDVTKVQLMRREKVRTQARAPEAVRPSAQDVEAKLKEKEAEYEAARRRIMGVSAAEPAVAPSDEAQAAAPAAGVQGTAESTAEGGGSPPAGASGSRCTGRVTNSVGKAAGRAQDRHDPDYDRSRILRQGSANSGTGGLGYAGVGLGGAPLPGAVNTGISMPMVGGMPGMMTTEAATAELARIQLGTQGVYGPPIPTAGAGAGYGVPLGGAYVGCGMPFLPVHTGVGYSQFNGALPPPPPPQPPPPPFPPPPCHPPTAPFAAPHPLGTGCFSSPPNPAVNPLVGGGSGCTWPTPGGYQASCSGHGAAGPLAGGCVFGYAPAQSEGAHAYLAHSHNGPRNTLEHTPNALQPTLLPNIAPSCGPLPGAILPHMTADAAMFRPMGTDGTPPVNALPAAGQSDVLPGAMLPGYGRSDRCPGSNETRGRAAAAPVAPPLHPPLPSGPPPIVSGKCPPSCPPMPNGSLAPPGPPAQRT